MYVAQLPAILAKMWQYMVVTVTYIQAETISLQGHYRLTLNNTDYIICHPVTFHEQAEGIIASDIE